MAPPTTNVTPDREGPYVQETFDTYDHLTWYVSSAKYAAAFYVNQLGFQEVGYSGLETNSKDIVARVVKQGSVVMIFKSTLRHKGVENDALVQEIHEHISRHGDGVKDVAFRVHDVQTLFDAAVAGGMKPVRPPMTVVDDYGTIITATVRAYGDTTHTLVNRDNYSGLLPGYKVIPSSGNKLDELIGPCLLQEIDHCVGNQGWNRMDEVCRLYEKSLGFHRFWSVDDTNVKVRTKYSALKSVVMASPDERIKMPINEPAEGLKKSQIQEYIEFYDGPGIQHIALRTPDILHTVDSMCRRGLEFINVPDVYYDQLQERLRDSPVRINEDLEQIKRLNILVDFDSDGYLLQIFTKPLVDRPTVFVEIIQRNHFEGFGAGNFKSLFESIERDQALRGTL